MIFEKQGDKLKVLFTISDKYGHYFSSTEEAFASINPASCYSYPGTGQKSIIANITLPLNGKATLVKQANGNYIMQTANTQD